MRIAVTVVCVLTWLTVAARGQTVIAPGLQPQVAADGQGNVYVVYGTKATPDGKAAVWCATSTDTGRSFAPPVKVADAADLPLGKRRGPRVATASGAVIITAVVDREVVRWRSTDRGRGWSAPLTITDSPAAAREGFNTVASDGHDHLFAAWLDMREGKMQVWGATSTDAGRTFGPDVRVYASPAGHVCECCSVSAAFTPTGDVLVMFRNWDGANRDLYLARSTDAGHTFAAAEKLGGGTWPLNACPMDGGSLAATGDDDVVTVWRRQSQLFLAHPGRPETLLADGMQPVVTFLKTKPLIAWIDHRGGDLIYTFDTGPHHVLSHSATDPAIAALPGGKTALLTWERDGKILAKTIP